MNKPEQYILVFSCTQKYTPNYNIHRTGNVTVMYLDTFINNVSRYVAVSRYIWNVTVTYLDTFEMYLPQVWCQNGLLLH